MGIRGLATFINRYSNKYLEDYKLQNCYLVIDGNSLACQLYGGSAKLSSAFGGDYDRYANSVFEFFRNLQRCKISPIVIFDGGYERQKLKTAFIRIEKKWQSARYVRPGCHGKIFFPLFLKETFKDVLKELQIPFAQCLFEADVEIAAIARNLKCPVLSYDSDYFVYNVLYIPFPTMHLLPYKDESIQTTDKTYYLYCKIFRVESFLKRSGGIQKDVLPFLSIMLGCDYIGNRVLKLFVSHLKQKKCNTSNKSHKRIYSLLEWLSTETLESAKTKVLSCLKKHKRRGMIQQIDKIMSYYTDGSSELLSVLGIEVPSNQSEFSNEAKNVLQLLKAHEDSNTTGDEDKYSDESDASDNEARENDENTDNGEDSEQDEDKLSNSCSSKRSEISSESEGDSEVYEEEIEKSNFESGGRQSKEIKMTSYLPQWFLKCFKHGLFPSGFMDMLVHQLYFVPAQVEDYDYPSSHNISVPIIGVIYGLIVGNTIDKCLKCIIRSFHKNNKFLDVQPVLKNASVKFPPLNDLPDLPISERFLILMETAGLNSDDQKCVLSLPLPWQLYIIALVFWAKQTEQQPQINDSHIDSLLLCLILLNVAGNSVGCLGSTKLGRNKRKKNLLKIKSSVNKKPLITLGMIPNCKTEISGGSINSCAQNDNLGVKVTESNLDTESTQKEKESAVKDLNANLDVVVEALEIVSLEECVFMKKILHPYCVMDKKLKVRPKLFCIATVHSFAQFQSCLMHLTYLNALLGFPFSHCISYQVFSSTFVYNMYNNLNRRTDSLHYICQLLSTVPSFVALFKVLRVTVNKLISKISLYKTVKRKRNKKKHNHKVQEKIEIVKDDKNDSVQSVDSDFEDPCNRFTALKLDH